MLAEAEEAYRTASNLDPKDDDIYLEWGVFYYNQHRWDEALACLEQAQRLNPNNEDALLQQGDTLVNMEKYDEALEISEILTRRKPKSWKAWSNYVLCCLHLGLYDKAIPAAQRVTRLCPDNAEGYEMLGDALLETGRPDKALPQYDKAVRLDPECLSALGGKGYCLVLLERYKEALACYEEVTREVDDDYEYWNCMGVALHNLQRDDEALECYQKALELYPEYVLAIGNMADVYWKRKEYERAEKLYREAYDLDPENRRHDLFSVVLCQNNTKRYAEMVPLLQTLLPYAQEDKQCYAYFLGTAYKNLEQYEEALKYFYLEQETFTDGPEYEMCLFNCAFCEEKLEHYDKAATAIKKLIEQSYDDEIRALGLYRLGVLCLRQQQFAMALEHFDQAFSLDPEMEEYQQAREEALKHIKSEIQRQPHSFL